MAEALKAYPGCPTFTWMIANRVTNPYDEQDAFITFTGRKGSSKSTSSIAFAEELAKDIARLRNKGEDPKKFFNITHIRSISETGAIELLTSGILKKQNSVILLDDTGTQWGARNFATMINKYLNMILQIARVYRCVIIANFIMQAHIDVQARTMTDFRVEMLYKDVSNKQAVFKVKYIEQGQDTVGHSKEYGKYLTWKGKRIKWWVITLPSEELYKEYRKMRTGNTDEFIELAQKKIRAKVLKIDDEENQDKRYHDPLTDKHVLNNRHQVLSLLSDQSYLKKDGSPNVYKISNDTGLGRSIVGKIIGLHKSGRFNDMEDE